MMNRSGGAETKIAILRYSPNSLPALGFLAGLVSALVVGVYIHSCIESSKLYIACELACIVPCHRFVHAIFISITDLGSVALALKIQQ